MLINQLLEEQNITSYQLSKQSGVPMTTTIDICSGKANLERCMAGTLHRLAKVLGTTVDEILEANEREAIQEKDYRASFENFKSTTCHKVKDLGDMDFIISVLEEDEIRKFYEKRWYREAFYLLGMLDYLSRVNELPKCTTYDDIRKNKLKKLSFPQGVIAETEVTGDETYKKEALKHAIPEFLQFNIVESEVRNVC